MKAERKIGMVFGALLASAAMLGALYTTFTNGNTAAYPIYIVFAVIGGYLISGNQIPIKLT